MNSNSCNPSVGFGLGVRWLFFAYLVIFFVDIFVVIFCPHLFFGNPFIRDFSPIFIHFILFIAVMLGFCLRCNIDLGRLFSVSRFVWSHWRWIGLVFPLYTLNESTDWMEFFCISRLSSSLANRLFNFHGIQYPFALTTAVYFIIFIAVVAVAEEVFFRGILLHRLAYKWGLLRAVVISALIFGFLSVNFVSSFAFGLVLVLVYLETRTLLVPIMINVAYNALVFLWPDGILDGTEFRNSWALHVFFLITSVAVLFAVIRRCWPTNDQSLPYYDEKIGQPNQGKWGEMGSGK